MRPRRFDTMGNADLVADWGEAIDKFNVVKCQAISILANMEHNRTEEQSFRTLEIYFKKMQRYSNICKLFREECEKRNIETDLKRL